MMPQDQQIQENPCPSLKCTGQLLLGGVSLAREGVRHLASMTTRRYAFRVWSSTMYRAHTEFHASSRRTSAKA